MARPRSLKPSTSYDLFERTRPAKISSTHPIRLPRLTQSTPPSCFATLRISVYTAAALFLAHLHAAPAFTASEVQGPGSDILFCDLDGDRLKDAILIAGTNLTIFYQDSKNGFGIAGEPAPTLRRHFDGGPSLLCPAQLAGAHESLLVMNNAGIDELSFTNRTSPPTRRNIVSQKTAVPQSLQGPQFVFFPFAARAGNGPPLLLLPADDGLQVWSCRGNGSNSAPAYEWRRVQSLSNPVQTRIRPFIKNPGYSHSFDLDLCISDINGDGRDDLLVSRRDAAGFEHFSLYLQTPEGSFMESVLNYTNRPDWHNALSWGDINQDGKVDLIKSTFLDEAFFVPGMRSGKVLVGTYLADGAGRIPAEPQQVFRKYDWSTALPMVDVDGDGFVDMALGYIPLNAREGFRKAITAEQIDFTLKVHFYRPNAGYPQEPDFQRDVLLQFHNEFFFTQERRLYYEQLLSLNGDFNGDGKKDLLVRDEKKAISVYFFISREKGFSAAADLKFNCPEPIDWWDIKDLNGDAVSDLIVKLRESDRYRIFVSQTNKQKAADGR